MPGANYMGGKRNAAKARVKDAVGRLEKSFFGQRRLCALSKGLLASKPKQKYNVPLEESLGSADISLSHARQKVPLNNIDVFIPSPIHISPCTPRSRRQLKEHSSSSNISKSAVIDALDVSEPMFLRRVLNRILTMPDLAGISGNRIKSAAATGKQPRVSDESSPLQWTKRKRSPSDLYEESDSLGTPSSLRDGQSYVYESICTPFQNKYTSSDQKIVGKERTRTFESLLVEDDMFPCWENTSSYHRDVYNMESTEVDAHEVYDSEVANVVRGYVQSSPWSSQDYRSSQYGPSLQRFGSNYTPYSNPDPREIMNGNESHTSIPSSIVFLGLKDRSARGSMVTAYPVEEQTVYGTLFEQDDPWDAIGQILGLSNTKVSKSLGEEINDFSEIEEGGTSLGPRLAVVKTEEDLMSVGSDEIPRVQYTPVIESRLIGLEQNRTFPRSDSLEESETEELGEDLMNVYSDEIPLVQYTPVIESRLIGLEQNRAFPRYDSLEEYDKPEIPGYVRTDLNQSTQLSYLRKDVEEIAQGSEDDQDCLSLDIEDKRKSPGGTKTEAVGLDVLECREQGNEESKSVLAIPELQEMDGVFMGPSLFNDLDEGEDEI